METGRASYLKIFQILSWILFFSSYLVSAIAIPADLIPSVGLDLKILPLGDSITYGIASSTRDGYRGYLYQQLVASGATVDYIGTQKSGNVKDNENEGWSGYTIEQISNKATPDIPKNPDVILLMAGTNDVNLNRDLANAPKRLGQLIDKLVAGVPSATVLVATLTPLRFNQAKVDQYNAALPAIVQQRASAGKKVALVSMAAVQANELADGVHPNDAGYKKMADAWYKGIEAATAKGWIGSPY